MLLRSRRTLVKKSTHLHYQFACSYVLNVHILVLVDLLGSLPDPLVDCVLSSVGVPRIYKIHHHRVRGNLGFKFRWLNLCDF